MEPLTIKTIKPNLYWDKMLQIANFGRCKHSDNMIKYFNSNKTNPIYSQQNYSLTKILAKAGDFAESAEGITITKISQETFNRKMGQKVR